MGQFCVWIIRCCNGSCGADGILVVLGYGDGGGGGGWVVEVDVGSLLLLFHDKKVWGESMTREQR